MRAPRSQGLPRLALGCFGLGLVGCLTFLRHDRGPGDEAPEPPGRGEIAAGRALFLHEWSPGGRVGLDGDGLGPAYNEVSCVACHNRGGVAGGAGSADKNVELLSMSRGPTRVDLREVAPRRRIAVGFISTGESGSDGGPGSLAVRSTGVGFARSNPDPMALIAPTVSGFLRDLGRIEEDGFALAQLVGLHPGFREASTVTLHRFGTDPAYASWRDRRFPVLSAGRLLGRMDPEMNAMMGMPSMVLGDDQSLPILRPEPPGPLGGGMFGMGFGMNPPGRALPEAQARIIGNVTAPTSELLIGPLVVTRSQRNPTPLFGLGLIDAIPEAAIESEARRQVGRTPATAGRVGRVTGGRVGRLGWKGQTASVEDFVLDACAVEVGLEVPGHHQGALPPDSLSHASGLDLTAEECASLVAFVKSLPRPVERPATGENASAIAEGRRTFAAIGCADCHTPDLGSVPGLYSDLLLHDMGSLIAVSGSYNTPGGIQDDPSSDEGESSPLLAEKGLGPVFRDRPGRATPGATRREWRTPPLWGVCDSGPYLHDGRAQSVEEAIAFHGGQGEASARRFFELGPEARRRVFAFLNTLISPGIDRPSRRAAPDAAG